MTNVGLKCDVSSLAAFRLETSNLGFSERLADPF